VQTPIKPIKSTASTAVQKKTKTQDNNNNNNEKANKNKQSPETSSDGKKESVEVTTKAKKKEAPARLKKPTTVVADESAATHASAPVSKHTSNKKDYVEITFNEGGKTKAKTKPETKLPSVIRQLPAAKDSSELDQLSPVIDCKALEKDELLSLLRSANETTPISLKSSIICSYTAKSSRSQEISVKKNDIVYLLYVFDGFCHVRNKKGKRGFIPFSCTSASLALADSTPKTRKRLFGSKSLKKRRSIDSGSSAAEQDHKTPLKPTKSSVKERRLSVESLDKKKEQVKTRFEPLKDHSTTVNGSPTIKYRNPVHSEKYFSDAETLENREHKEFVKRGRSKSVDQILDVVLPKSFKKKTTSDREDLVQPLNVLAKSRASSLNASDEFNVSIRPHRSNFDKYCNSSFDTVDEFDILETKITSDLGRRASNSSTSGFSETSRGSSLERLLSPTTQRKLKTFPSASTEKDMNKLRAFGRKLSSKSSSSAKEKGLRKSSSSSRMSDSELSTSSYNSIVKTNNTKNGSSNGRKINKHKRTHSLTDNSYHLNWYKEWNIEPSDSSDSEEDEDCTTTDTESLKVKVKTSIKEDQQQQHSFSDYETKIGMNRLRYRRTSDVSASSEMYIPKRQQLRGESNNNNVSSNSSGFAQIYKTKSAMIENKVKSSSSDVLSDNKDQNKEMEERLSNLKKNRLSSSNNSIQSNSSSVSTSLKSKSKTKARGSVDTERNDKLLSPLVPKKVGDRETPASEILLGKSLAAPERKGKNSGTAVPSSLQDVLQQQHQQQDNVMIVKSDYISQEDNYVTILTCQHVEVLDKSDDEWWCVRSPSGQVGLVPKDFLMAKPKIPTRKPDASLLKRVGSIAPKGYTNDLNNNNNRGIMTAKSKNNIPVNLPPTQQIGNTPPLAKVAPLIRAEPDHVIDDISLQKQQLTDSSVIPPSYNHYMLTRQKSDMTDMFYSNRTQPIQANQEPITFDRNAGGTSDAGGASRIVRRRSFSGRQKKVRFANQISTTSSGDEGPRYQNSPGQILIVRQPRVPAASTEDPPPSPKHAEQEVEIATWC